MKLILCLLAVLCPFLKAGATPIDTPVRALQIGNHVPDLLVKQVLNNKTGSLKLTDYKGHLLILDFMATNCASCIKALPSLEAVQRRLGDSIRILAISYEKATVVHGFLKRRRTSLPMVAEDKQLAALFPHRLLSHEVWIDDRGIVVAITEPDYVTITNSEAFIHHQPISLPLKNDVAGFDYDKRLSQDTARFYRAILPYQPGVAPKFGVTRDSLHHTLRMWIINFPILSLYMLATDHLLYFPKTLQDIHLRDTSLIRVPAGTYRDTWKPGHTFCYEAVLPEGTGPDAIKAAMIADLNQHFNIKGGMEKRMAPCLSLERIPGTTISASRGGIPLNTLHSKNPVKLLHNSGLVDLIWELNDLPGGLPAIDQTGFTGNVDLSLQINGFQDLKQLNTMLEPYGLVVQEKTAALEFFVLRDAN